MESIPFWNCIFNIFLSTLRKLLLARSLVSDENPPLSLTKWASELSSVILLSQTKNEIFCSNDVRELNYVQSRSSPHLTVRHDVAEVRGADTGPDGGPGVGLGPHQLAAG